MKRKPGIKLFRSQSDRVLAMAPTPGASDEIGGASEGKRKAKSGDDLSLELEAMDLEKTRTLPATNNLARTLHASSSFSVKMRPKKHGGGSGGGFRLSSLLPGGGGSSKNLTRTSDLRAHNPLRAPQEPGPFSSLTSTASENESFDSCQLLSVRKRSCSDSGHESSSNASPVLRTNKEDKNGKQKNKSSSSSSGGGFFRFFNRSATLLFQHPPAAEHGRNRAAYKGITSSSTKDLRSSHHPILGNNNNSKDSESSSSSYRRHHHRRGLSASSSSSLSSSAMHHHLENVVHNPANGNNGEMRSLPAHLLRRLPLPPVGSRGGSLPSASSGVETVSSASSSVSSSAGGARPRGRQQQPSQQQQPPAASSSSSSNSVISSDYDSGAFSRTSTPDLGTTQHFQRLQAQIQELTRGGASKSSLALAAPTAPLHAPKLVIDACKKTGSTHHLACVDELEPAAAALASLRQDSSSPDARLILDCLNAASRSSAFLGNGVSLTHTSPTASLARNYSGPASIDSNDVSITIGTNTKLTISPLRAAAQQGSSDNQSPRRSRSGLPVLGTAGLTSPMKSVRGSPTGAATSRSRISTVYLANGATGRDRSLPRSLQKHRQQAQPRGVSRSESSVTLLGGSSSEFTSPPITCCGERVTVNGQHYHCDSKSCASSPPGTQPSSFIDI